MTENVRLNTKILTFIDGTFSDSDKTIGVPDDKEWDIQSIFVELATTAVVGNRQITIFYIAKTGEIMGLFAAGAVVPASQIVRLTFAPGLADQTVVVNDALNTSLPKMRLGESQSLRIFDSAAIDPTNDNMFVHVSINERRG